MEKMINNMNTSFDNELGNIDIYKIHPTLIPFVGKKYDQYRILQIGESHYIGQTVEDKSVKYDISYFYDNWWKLRCVDLENDYPEWINTRWVVYNNYLKGLDRSYYAIFNNVIKSFSNIVFGREIENFDESDKELYHYFAFMNFFQMPSIFQATSYGDSLSLSAKRLGNGKLADDMWRIAVENAVATLDQVIQILEPQAVVFTSVLAGRAYYDYMGKYKDDGRIIYSAHPAYPFTWNKKLVSLDFKTGKETFEEGLKRIYC